MRESRESGRSVNIVNCYTADDLYLFVRECNVSPAWKQRNERREGNRSQEPGARSHPPALTLQKLSTRKGSGGCGQSEARMGSE